MLDKAKDKLQFGVMHYEELTETQKRDHSWIYQRIDRLERIIHLFDKIEDLEMDL